MQTQLLTVATALIASACALPCVARTPEPVNAPSPIPEGITVDPPQGFVDTANPVSPRGVSSIGLTFSGSREVMPNPARTAEAKLYYNDFTTPIEVSREATVDQMTWRTVGVLFKERTWKLEGVYKVEIPEGMFLYVDGADGSGERYGTDPTPAMTLYYEIYRGYNISPVSGPVQKLDYMDISFPDADELTVNSSISGAQFYLDNSADPYSLSYSIEVDPATGKQTMVRLKLMEADGSEVTKPGTYGINIPAGAFSFRVYGADYATDPTDYVEYSTNEMLAKYVVIRGEQPEIEPSPEDEVKSLGNFRLYLPDGMNLWFANTMGKSYLYQVDEVTGEIDDTRIIAHAVADDYINGDSFVTLGLYDPVSYERLTEFVPSPGTYCLITSRSLLYGEWPATSNSDAFTGGSDPYYYYYRVVDISSGVECPGAGVVDAQDGPIFNLQGVKVADRAVDAGHLPKGVYISGGRKIMIR